MLKGASTDLYKEILAAESGLYLIASGGVSKIEDIIELDEAGVPAVITGKAIYEGKITLEQISKLLA
jgi:phosphoribosylformimino-5-aminoimidazole carboxamide ribotide isomerase